MTEPTSRAAGHSGTILAFVLLLLIGQNLIYPQAAYPLHGLFTNAVLSGLFLLALLFGGVRSFKAGPIAFGAILYFLILLYVNGRNAASPLARHLGAFHPATLTIGFWAFVIGALAARNDALSFPPDQSGGEGEAMDGGDTPSHHISIPRLAVAMLVMFGLLMCLYALYQYTVGYEESRRLIDEGEMLFASDEIRIGVEHALRERRVAGTFGNPNLLGAFISLILPGSLMLLFASRRRTTRAGALAALAALIAALFLSGSRGGLLTALFSIAAFCGIYFWLGRHPRNPRRTPSPKFHKAGAAGSIILGVALAGAILSAAVPAPQPSGSPVSAETREYKQNFIDRLFITTTVQQRLYYWQIGWEIFKSNPILGSGAGMYAILYPQHRPPEARETRFAHNFVVQSAAEDGLIGLALYLAWAGAIGWAGWQAVRRCPHHRTRAALAALLALFLAFHFNALIEYTFYYRGLFLIMAAAAGFLWGYRPEAPAGEGSGWHLVRWRNHLVLGLTAAASLISAVVWIPRPMMVEYYLDWGDLFWSDRNFQEAGNYYHRAYALAPGHPDVLLRLAAEAAQEGKSSAERQYLERAATEGNPLSAALRSRLAEWHQRQGEYREALERVHEALIRYPNSPRYHFQEAVILKHLGQTAEAKAAYRRAVDLGVNDPLFQLFLREQKEY